MRKRRLFLWASLAALIGLGWFRGPLRQAAVVGIQNWQGRKTISNRVAEYGVPVRGRLAADFARLSMEYPPRNLVLLGFKNERLLEVWVSADGAKYHWLKTYPIVKASGRLGPKLQNGDLQVPEGFYQVESLNPNSLYHLALRLNYPNAFDWEQGRQDGRADLGSDIMIHGRDCSIGCLAMGNEAAEDLFVLAAETGCEQIKVILSPVDFRRHKLPADLAPLPAWTTGLYADLRRELAQYPPQP